MLSRQVCESSLMTALASRAPARSLTVHLMRSIESDRCPPALPPPVFPRVAAGAPRDRPIRGAMPAARPPRSGPLRATRDPRVLPAGVRRRPAPGPPPTAARGCAGRQIFRFVRLSRLATHGRLRDCQRSRATRGRRGWRVWKPGESGEPGTHHRRNMKKKKKGRIFGSPQQSPRPKP